MSCNVVTVAVGNPYYKQLTKNLYYSFLKWNELNGITFQIITDDLPAFDDLKKEPKVSLSYINDGTLEGFTSKFSLNDYANGEKNLFIDCDCLIYKDLTKVFKLFENTNFGAIGTMQNEGDFFCDIYQITSKFKIDHLPVFVGSVYYFQKNIITKNVFDKAVELKQSYDQLGFKRLRGKENEEPLFATAMSLLGEKPIFNTKIKADAMFYKTISANVLKGTNKLILEEKNINNIYANGDESNIAIIHFNDAYSDKWLYKLEAFRLKNKTSYSLPHEVFGLLTIKLPEQFKNTVKKLIRPIFNKLFGYRKIKETKRI